MPPGWLDRAAVAITAETGEATNNHDVMNLEVRAKEEYTRACSSLLLVCGRCIVMVLLDEGTARSGIRNLWVARER